MKKIAFILCTCCLVWPSQEAFGQKKVSSVQKALTALLRPTKGQVASITAGLTDAQLEQVFLKLQAENAALECQLAAQRNTRQHVLEVSRPAVFRVLSSKHSDISFSGTLFKTTYQGKEEIFGVVPMHVLRTIDGVKGTLSYKFTAGVFTQTGIQFLPAYIVQISSSKTGDVALVKFRTEDEKKLSPLPLDPAEPVFPQQAYGQGFANNLLSHQSFELVGKTSNNVLLAQIPAANRGERAGFCGSPVVNAQAQLTGIHVGSRYEPQDPAQRAFFNAFQLSNPSLEQGDVGYVTPVSFLEKLVETYHHPSAKPFAVLLAGQEITRLGAQEYVSGIEILDKDERILWQKNTQFKVSYSAVETVLRLRPDAAYVRLYIGQTRWVHNEKGWHIEDTDRVSSVLYPLKPAALRP